MTPLVNRENPLLGFVAGTHAITLFGGCGLGYSVSPAFHQSGRLYLFSVGFTAQRARET